MTRVLSAFRPGSRLHGMNYAVRICYLMSSMLTKQVSSDICFACFDQILAMIRMSDILRDSFRYSGKIDLFQASQW